MFKLSAGSYLQPFTLSLSKGRRSGDAIRTQ